MENAKLIATRWRRVTGDRIKEFHERREVVGVVRKVTEKTSIAKKFDRW